MDEIVFKVQGSSAEPYLVTFTRRSKNILSAYCTCPAGFNGQYCKHRLNILGGNLCGVVSGNEEQGEIVMSWLIGTDLDVAIRNMRDFESEADRVKLALKSAKKEVAKAMNN